MPVKIELNCPACKRTLYAQDSEEKVQCVCGHIVLVQTVFRFGKGVRRVLETFGIKKKAGCGCTQREAWLDNLGASLGRAPQRTVPASRMYPNAVYITTKDLVDTTIRLLAPQLRADKCTAVVGLPRSGMIPASILAAELHVPLFSYPDICLRNGHRSSDLTTLGDNPILIDDTVHSGATFKRHPFDGKRGVAFTTSKGKDLVDFYGGVLETPHILEWNIFNTFWTEHIGTDMDGVLCFNCNPAYDDDGERYLEFLEQVPPLHLPVFKPIKAIISARLEKYRKQTEQWLQRYGVKYQNLILWPHEDPKTRTFPEVVKWKAEWAERLGCEIFLESEQGLANAMDQHCLVCQPVWVRS